MPEKLIHYSRKPLKRLYSTPQVIEPDCKPQGLWVSVDSAWRDWCKENQYGVSSLVHQAQIELKPAARVLRLESAGELDKFSKSFGQPYSYEGFDIERVAGIDWRKIAGEFQGIMIAPYIWERRLSRHTFWYYGWDVASGCIWDAEAVESVTALPLEEAVG